MKRFSLLIAVILGLGTGSIVSADVYNDNWQVVENPSLIRWRFDPEAAQSSMQAEPHPYDVASNNLMHIQNPAHPDRIYHRAVVTTERKGDIMRVNFKYVENPSMIRDL